VAKADFGYFQQERKAAWRLSFLLSNILAEGVARSANP
jgi:hypothetical protein